MPAACRQAGPLGCSLRSDRDTTFRTVDFLARHHRPGDARHLVCERHGHQPDGAMLQDGPEPGADPAVLRNFRLISAFPASFTPWIWKTDLAVSRPIMVMLIVGGSLRCRC